MVELIEFLKPPTGTSIHPAVLAWGRLRRETAEAGKVSIVHKRPKSAVFRIERIGPRGSAVIAKCCHREVAARERLIYEQILPKLPITTPRYYGFVEGDDRYDWLFLECAKGEPYSRERPLHAALAGRWLALLHTSAERIAATAQLPQLSPSHYLAQLAGASARLSDTHLNLSPEDLAVVRSVIEQCKFLESRWDQICRWCDRMPLTLVHADFKPRNLLIRKVGKGHIVLPFDWEASGWGVPAEDLAYVDLDAYYSVSRHLWPNVSMRDLLCMKQVGRIFRGIVEFSWESTKFKPEWEVSAVKLQYYQLQMAEALAMVNWDK